MRKIHNHASTRLYYDVSQNHMTFYENAPNIKLLNHFKSDFKKKYKTIFRMMLESHQGKCFKISQLI